MKILITGAGGFLGRYVLNEIATSHPEIEAILLSSSISDRRFTVIPSRNYTFDSNYLYDNGCADVDAIIHIGAFTPKSISSANSIKGCNSNISSTATLLSSYLPAVKKFLYLSTLDVYAPTPETISETTPCIPQTLYGMSKLYCEKMVSAHCEENHVVYQILRIGHVYGTGEEVYRKVMPVMIENALKDDPIEIYGDGSTKRSFIYAKDVAKAIISALNLTSSNIINIVGDSSITLKELASLIIKLSGSHSEIKYLPATGLEKDITFDVSRMKQLIPIHFTNFEVGLSKEIHHNP